MATPEGEGIMDYNDLIEKIHVEGYQWEPIALLKVIDLHRPIATKKGRVIESNCMTCIVYRPGGWSNRKYPCPTIQAIESEIS
jgi:hypothetical protein